MRKRHGVPYKLGKGMKAISRSEYGANRAGLVVLHAKAAVQ